jgi:hypothetical protein
VPKVRARVCASLIFFHNSYFIIHTFPEVPASPKFRIIYCVEETARFLTRRQAGSGPLPAHTGQKSKARRGGLYSSLIPKMQALRKWMLELSLANM